jgi:hypothetical protein
VIDVHAEEEGTKGELVIVIFAATRRIAATSPKLILANGIQAIFCPPFDWRVGHLVAAFSW